MTYWPKWSTRAVESTWQSPDALDMVEGLAREVGCPLCGVAAGDACRSGESEHRRAAHGSRVCRGLARAKVAAGLTTGAAQAALAMFNILPQKKR